ncbi:MAG: serine--tRNA ligase, partial [Dehalococcoidia bacterium]
MLSVQYIRENTDRVRRDLLLRNVQAPINRILELDQSRRSLLQEVEGMRAERNAASRVIGRTKDPADKQSRIAAMRALGEKLSKLETSLGEVEAELNKVILEVPNVLDASVPPGPDGQSNVVVEEVGERRPFGFQPRPHWEVGAGVAGLDLERGVKMSGSRFYVLRGGVARLQRALVQFMLDSHSKAGFREHYLPLMLSEASLYASGQLPKFRENLYHDDEEDYFLIPTAEVAFVNLYRDEIIPPDTLPLRLVGHTPCFRREKMSAGRDVRGIKRVHQFEKVELFSFCEPDASGEEYQLLLSRARSIPEALGLPFRLVQLCSGDVGFNATSTLDIEVWAPGAEEWLEVSSISNCLDFQARRANIRYRPDADSGTRFPHMLNGSGLALPRTVAAVLENYQREDGDVDVPEVLQ